MKLPPYHIFPNITGHKIVLRQVLPTDIEGLIEISFYDSIQATTLAEAIAMQEKINKDYNDGNSIHWGIADITTNIIAGTCGYYRGLDKGDGELGCVLLPQFRGQGFMTSAMQLAINFGLNIIGLKRVFAITAKQNLKAINLLNRLHFIRVSELQEEQIEYELRTNV